MSEFSRETLLNIIETDHVQCGEASALARMVLAAMGDEPHTDDELSNLLWYSQEATCHSDPNYYCEFQRLAKPGFIAGIIRELQERRKADSEPVAYAWVSRSGKKHLTRCEPEQWRDAVILTPLYRHAQPAPVVPDVMEPTIEAIKRILPTSNPDEYAACIGADMWNACRAAMLNGGKP
ncbi:TPA: hypothetical protein ACTW6W_005516 [Raoultella ornithinolytica]